MAELHGVFGDSTIGKLGRKQQHFPRIQNAILSRRCRLSRCLLILTIVQELSLKTESGNNIGSDSNIIEDRDVCQKLQMQTVLAV